ncbi:MAG: hypothetical protein J0L52_05275 [Caulobacterales bacterium]|nr:hypothetical protein [Caulobacterales bacterium]
MTVGLKRFKQIMDAYGADPTRWPEAERAEAEALLATSSDARQMRDEAELLDAWLDAATTPDVSELTSRRILKQAPGSTRMLSWGSGAGWAAAAAAGVVLGLSLGNQFQLSSQADDGLEQAMTWSVDEAEYFG